MFRPELSSPDCIMPASNYVKYWRIRIMNKKESKSFRDQLLSQEQSDTHLQEKFQLEADKVDSVG